MAIKTDDINIDRLVEVKRFGYQKLQNFRKQKLKFIESYVGHDYAGDTHVQQYIVNMMELGVNIFTRHLVSANPSVLMSTKQKSMKWKVELFNMHINLLLAKMCLQKELEALAYDAMFSTGFAEVAYELDGTVVIGDQEVNRAVPRLRRISLDDWFHDAGASSWDGLQVMGYRFRRPLEDVKGNELYDKAARRRVEKTDLEMLNITGESKTQLLSGTSREVDSEELEDGVDLLKVYLPHKKVALIMTDESTENSEPIVLQRIDWKGPPRGPFHRLGFELVPDNIMSLPPAAIWYSMNRIINEMHGKMAEQGIAQKDVLLTQKAYEQDAEAIRDADNMDVVTTDGDPRLTQVLSFGGVNNNNILYSNIMRELLTYVGGNWDMLGGLAPQAPTLGQDQILAASASLRMLKMQEAMVNFTEQVVRDMGWWEWRNPLLDVDLVYQIPNLTFMGEPLEVQASLTSDDLSEDDFYNTSLEIDPYSMQRDTPATRLKKLMETFTGIIAPMQQTLLAHGKTVDPVKFLHHIERLGHIPELNDIVVDADQQVLENMQNSQTETGKPPVTERIYTRNNRSQTTRPGKDQAMNLALMGAAQPSQSAMANAGGS